MPPMFEEPRRLHPAAILINLGRYFKQMIGAVAFPLIAMLASGRNSKKETMALMIGIFGGIISVLALIGPVLAFFSTTFSIHDNTLVISSGFIWRKCRTIPLARIQNVNIERTIWHRLLGAAAVKVETASGGGAEGELAALSMADANALQAALLHHAGTEPVEQPKLPEALFSLTPKQVFLAGALGNRLMYIIAGILGVFQFDNISEVSFRPLARSLSSMSPVAGAMLATAAFFGLVVVGWLVSIGMSATRFYGFRIERHERGLLLTHGLLTQFKSIVPLGRVQVVRIVQPIFFRLFDYCEVYADTAGSFDSKDVASANKVCPILEVDRTQEIGRLLLPTFDLDSLHWKHVSRKAIRRHAIRSFLTWAILLVPVGIIWLKWQVLWALIPLAILCWISGILYFRYVAYATNQNLLASRQGILRKQIVVMPFDRIQHYTINASYFQRLAGLSTVTVVSAAAGGHPVTIVDVDIEAAQELRRKLTESIREHRGNRTGGL